MHVEYLDTLPSVELDMDKVYDIIQNSQNEFYVPDNDYYGLFEPYEEIVNLGSDMFDDQHHIKLHVMYPPRLPVHKDSDRFVAYNYIIDPGGDEVYTCFYDDDQNLIEQVKIETGRWHRLDVNTFHNVEGMTRPRIALTVWQTEHTNWPEAVVEVDYKFDDALLWQEYNRMKDLPQPEYKFKTAGVEQRKTVSGMGVYGTQEYNVDSVLTQEARKFCKQFNIEDDIFAQFMWLDKDFTLPWHTDDATVCKSSLNYIMTDDPAPVEFGEGEFYYKCAALDVMREHRVNNSSERVLMRISFRTLTHDRLVNEHLRNAEK